MANHAEDTVVMSRKLPFFSNGLSWSAIGIIGTIVLTIGIPMICFAVSISSELGKISTTLERVATDLVDNKDEHKEFRKTIVDLNISANDHERRITAIETKKPGA